MKKRLLVLAWAVGFQCAGTTCYAQLDPLLFLKAARPRVVIALDLSSRMQRNLENEYRDPSLYHRTGESWEEALGVAAASDAGYRRAFPALRWLDRGGDVRAVAESVRVVGDRHLGFVTFDAGTRLGLVRAALSRAIAQNEQSVAFGLVVSRQQEVAFRGSDTGGVQVSAFPAASAPTDSGTPLVWRALLGEGGAAGSSLPPRPALVLADAVGSNRQIRAILDRGTMDPGALVPGGLDTSASVDSPMLALLEDARDESARLIGADTECRNTIVVLVSAGDQEPETAVELDDRAADFLRIAGHRVPVYAIALGPDQASGDRLRRLASRTGGGYVEIGAPAAGSPPAPESAVIAQAVHSIVRGINAAVQHGFARQADVDVLPTVDHPLGPHSEFAVAAPVVGTVNLEGAFGAAGQLLPGTRVTTDEGVLLPQKFNVVITAGFSLPGFDALVRASRVYRPEADGESATGFRFVADGTLLWTASAPTQSRRNIFTVLPGRGLVAFDAANGPLLAPYLRASDPVGLIEMIRGLPLGAATNSTPALLTPPSEGLADAEYQLFAAANAARRSLVFVGLDDGMMHAFDGRTGLEVWAVVPFNLLPRLRLLEDGQPVDAYRYYVGGSARLADVRTSAGWKTLMVFGEGPGGSFYQAFDVTLTGIALVLPPATDSADALLGWFSDPGRLPFLWSFPSYAHFDAAFGEDGDIAPGASAIEKSVGYSWSTPAVFRQTTAGSSVMALGSGPLPRGVEQQPNRAGTAAGTTLYLLDGATGTVLDTGSVGSDGVGEDPEACPAAGCGGLKNALAADPAVLVPGLAGLAADPSIYMGDLDGRLWRAVVQATPDGPRFAGQPRLLFEASAAHPLFAAVSLLQPGFDQVHIFFGTGSDLLPPGGASPGGRLLGLVENAAGITRTFDMALRPAGSDGGDERVSSMPVTAGEVVFFTTTVGSGDGCEPAEGRLFALTLTGGIAYDTNGDGRRDAGDQVRLTLPVPGRVTSPTVADRHVFVAAGDRLQVFGDPERFNQGPGFSGVRVLWWREVKD